MVNEYVDSEPCIPPSKTFKVEVPNYVSPVDRTYIKSQLTQLKLVEERAKETARYYRDRCANLKTKILHLELEKKETEAQNAHEKNQIRFFWRNKILEGQSRSGKMVRHSLAIQNTHII